MKNYVHKLDSLIKYYEFLEYKARVELGQINKEYQAIEREIITYKGYIEQSLISQETIGGPGSIGRELKLIPFMVVDLRKHIDFLQNKKKNLKPVYEKKVKELNEKKSKLDLVKNVRLKDKKVFIKDLQERELQELLEISVAKKMTAER